MPAAAVNFVETNIYPVDSDKPVLSAEGVRVRVFGSRQDWLKERRHYIGSSDASAVVGENPHTTAAKVAESKWSDVPEVEKDVPTYIRLGQHLEPFIASEYVLAVPDAKIIHPPKNYIVLNDNYPQLSATPDFFIHRPEFGWGVLECKSTGVWSKEDLDRHCIQLQHQMLVTGLSWGVIAWTTFRGAFDCEQFDADEATQKQMLAHYERFWADVLLKNPPLTDGRDDREVIRRLYGLREDTVSLPQEAVGLDLHYAGIEEQLSEVNARKKALDEQKAALQTQILALMKGAASAVVGETIYTRKTVERKGYTVEPTSYELFSRKAVKAKKGS